jgi:exopolysaccharide production protein ExoQ
MRNSERRIDKYHLLLFSAALIFYLTMMKQIVGLFGRDMTFTSRTLIWDELMKVGSKHPLLGVGYGSLWIGARGQELWSKLVVNQAHNGYIEIYVQLGIVGVFLLGMLLVQSYINIRAKRKSNFIFGIFSMAYLVMILISNITESSFMRSTDMLWMLCLCVCMQPPSALLRKNDALGNSIGLRMPKRAI